MSTSKQKSVSAFADSVATEAPLPREPLIALAMAAFITILTETLPAGLLPHIASGLRISEALAGQLVTIYAAGSLLTAIPLTLATQTLRRRPLLLAAIAGFVIANTVTTLSENIGLTMAARFVTGISAGLVWALLAGYAARMVPDHQKGRAIAVAMAGAPLALSLGVPAGTLLGNMIGWRLCFAAITLLAGGLMVWIQLRVPDFPGQTRTARLSAGQVLRMPGIRPVLFVILTFILSHNILYTYVSPVLSHVGLAEHTGKVLFIFGVTSLISIWIVGWLIDHHLLRLTLAVPLLFGIAVVVLALSGHHALMVYVAAAVWGLALGGAGTLFQTALLKAAGNAADIAQSMAVTAWNIAIAGGGLTGGILLSQFSVAAFPAVILVLLLAALVVIGSAKKHSFPATGQ